MPRAVVVGAGVFGASLAHRLAIRGWTVTLVEQYAPGHVRAASGGESRLLRCSHGPDRWYTRSAWRARSLWQELEEEAGERLFVPSGVVWFARRADGWEADSEAVLAEERVPFERIAPDDVGQLFPSFDPDGIAFALHEPAAGVLRARDAVRALVRLAGERGVRIVPGAARPAGAAASVDGEALTADRVVWACGAWLPRLFPDLVRIRVTRQDVYFFGAPASWETPPVPGWVDYDGAVYGLGDLDGRGVKVAPDLEGPELDPDADPRRASEEGEERARRYMRRRFPALAAAPLVGTRSCPYALTEDTNFLVSPHPEHDGVWLLGGGSGHGFKHGPALAEYVSGLLEGEASPDPRFGLAPRTPAHSLRTAGTEGETVPRRRSRET
ncbi:MAG: FAD-dependent oxidoreductase [Actinobacteria bacterium]|nr:FAD-dependent oxidoreductase [Actinomycetota bacterium]